MNFTVIFLFIFVNIISVVSVIYGWIKQKERILTLSWIAYMLTIGLLGGFATTIDEVIPAMEVYRGNTTLQITYEDSIPIDSVVVYKNK